jgi:hypothetical protein
MLGVDFKNFVSSSNHFSIPTTRLSTPESHPIDLLQSLDSFRPNGFENRTKTHQE